MALNQQQGIYEAKSPLPSLLSDLEQVAKIADGLKARIRARTKIGYAALIAGIIGLVLAAVTGIQGLGVLSFLAILGSIGWLIYSTVGRRKFGASRGRLDVAKERIAMIQPDAGEKVPFSLKLGLASNPTPLSEEAWARRKNGKQRLFEDCWFSLEGRLLDGTVITDEIKDLKRERTFSNPRGKRKTKSRVRYIVNVRFSYPKELYGDARAAGQALEGQIKVAPSAILRSVRVTEKAILLKAQVISENDIARTLGMLSMGAYRILNLARRVAAGQRGNAK